MELAFLDAEIPALVRRRGPFNIFRLFGIVSSEQAADQTLGYLLDPAERHGMGAVNIDALLDLAHGAPLIGSEGALGQCFDASLCHGSRDWLVERQVQAAAPSGGSSQLAWPGLIDLYLTNRERSTAVIVENKIDAPLNNPLETYARHAVDEGYETVLLLVLALYPMAVAGEHARWVSRSITYEELIHAFAERQVMEQPGHGQSLDARRSLDLLEQFMDIRKGPEE